MASERLEALHRQLAEETGRLLGWEAGQEVAARARRRHTEEDTSQPLPAPSSSSSSSSSDNIQTSSSQPEEDLTQTTV